MTISPRFLAALGALGAIFVASAHADCASGSVAQNGNCVCDYGYTPNSSFDSTTGDGCELCPDTFTTYSLGSSTCVCDGTLGFVADPSNPGECASCPQNSANSVYGYNGNCVTCSATDSFDTAHGCVCPYGSYGAYTASGSAPTCTQCPTGFAPTAFPNGGATQASDCQCDASQGYTEVNGVCSQCTAGEHAFNGNCLTCPSPSSVFVEGQGCVAAVGYYGMQTANGGAPAGGFTACPANSASNQGSTQASDCFCDSSNGYVKIGNSCAQCPASSNPFTPAGGSATCLTCDASSTFDPSQGCICNSGYYGTPSSTGISNCQACPANSVSFTGATTRSDCSCDASNGYMDNGSGTCVLASNGSQRARARRAAELHRRAIEARKHKCPSGQTACPIGSLGNFECIETESQIDSCGGCASLGQGVDCTSLPGVHGVGCEAGRCVVFSCAEGFVLAGNDQCISA